MIRKLGHIRAPINKLLCFFVNSLVLLSNLFVLERLVSMKFVDF